MTLHRRHDEEHDIDPADPGEVAAYLTPAEHTHCRGLCEHCGDNHPTKNCSTLALLAAREESAGG